MRDVKSVDALSLGLLLSNIQEFYFQKRRLQKIEFRNVSLHPGARTDVEIRVHGKRVETDEKPEVIRITSRSRSLDQAPRRGA